RYMAEMRSSTVNPGAASMPTLHALLAYFHAPWCVEIFAALAIAACVFVAVRRTGLMYALAALLAAGPLLAVHAYLSDCALLLPAGLALCTLTRLTIVRVLCVAVMSPPVLGLLKDGYPDSIAVPALLLVLCAAIAYESVRPPVPPRESDLKPRNGLAECSYGSV
ncbi:MAG: hypothetical protein ACREMY_07545, partial [bacterium]